MNQFTKDLRRVADDGEAAPSPKAMARLLRQAAILLDEEIALHNTTRLKLEDREQEISRLVNEIKMAKTETYLAKSEKVEVDLELPDRFFDHLIVGFDRELASIIETALRSALEGEVRDE